MGYIEKDNPERARTFALEIRAKTNGLSQFPEMGRPGRVPGTRELVVHSHYIIAYRIREDGVQLLRVHHVARRWPQHL